MSEYFVSEHQVASPPDDMLCSEWAERYRVLTPETTDDPGPWRNEKQPVGAGIMDAICSERAKKITVCGGTQIVKTEAAILNPIGYLIHKHPAPMMLMYPTHKKARDILRDRIKPVIENARDGVLKKRLVGKILKDGFAFAGGRLHLASSESEGSISSYPVKILFIDEADELVANAKWGDPQLVAEERLKGYYNTLEVVTGKPLNRQGTVWRGLMSSDYLFKPYVPCPHCGEQFVFIIENLFPKPESIKAWDGSAHYKCPHCSGIIDDSMKTSIIRRHVWRTEDGILLDDVLADGFKLELGFHVSSFYSLKLTFKQILKEYLSADTEHKKKVFYSGWLAEPYEPVVITEPVSVEVLFNRIEKYTPDILPAGVCALTAFADVQGNRLEGMTVGWATDYESWIIDRKIFYGGPDDAGCWRDLFRFLTMAYPHPCGTTLTPVMGLVDAGYRPEMVYYYINKLRPPRIFASVGSSHKNGPLYSKFIAKGSQKVPQTTINSHGLKEIIFERLNVAEGDPGYMHFGANCDEAFFEQLLSEKRVVTGEFPNESVEWKSFRRNEVWDMACGNYAALLASNISLEAYAQTIYGYFTQGA
jgi:phage terminase large subunit GpA-like protein